MGLGLDSGGQLLHLVKVRGKGRVRVRGRGRGRGRAWRWRLSCCTVGSSLRTKTKLTP